MRNDVKLGFAIGGVLLAVVIVFALVNSSGSEAVAPAPADGATAAATETPAPASPVEVQPVARSETPTPPAVVTPVAPVPPAEPVARAAESRSTDPWQQALDTGKLPMMMANTGPAAPGAAAPVIPASPRKAEPAPVTETKVSTPVANTPAAIEGAPAQTIVPLATRSEPDADGATRSPGLTRGTATTLQQPTSTVLKQVSARTHTIKNGETFSTIATAYYGHIRYARMIARANPGVDSTRLKIGQVINLPAFDPTSEARAAKAAATPTAVDNRTQYRVQNGDSLHRICMKLYGDPKKVDALYELNKREIGPNPTKLKLDMVLQLPAPPSVAQR